MSNHSGYDTLYSFLQSEIELNSIFCDFQKIYPRGMGRVLSKMTKLVKGSTFYNAQSLHAESYMIYIALTRRPDVIHFSYGEPYWGITNKISKVMNQKSVLTLHQPTSWWENNRHFLSKIDKANSVIALSEYDRAYLQTYLRTKVHYIPHGVDTSYYKPFEPEGLCEKKPFTVTFSGRYLRDLDTLCSVVKKISTTELNINFNIIYYDKSLVTHPGLRDIMKCKRVQWLSNLCEDEYLRVYQTSDICLIPLTDCTANNAVLEAMACGLPIVSTDLPALNSYLDTTTSILGRKNHPDDLCDAIIALYNDESLRRRLSSAARQKSVEQFDWVNIAAQTLNVFGE